jgi:hypothetical protein
VSDHTERPGHVAVAVNTENRMVGIRHERGYVVAGDRRIPIWCCSANGNRACQGHGERRPTTLREQPCKRAGHPASERRVNQNGHSFCTACQRDGYRVRKAA